MDATTQQLFDAALSLPDDDRVELVEALIASFRPDDKPPFDDSWCAVLQRRSAELRAGQATPVPWAEVKRSAQRKPVINTVFHPEAQGEYQAAFAWYQAHSPQASVRFEAEVERVIQLIESNPEGFPKYDDLHRYALFRRFPYSIVYQHWADQIYVVGVVHGSRLPGYWKNRT